MTNEKKTISANKQKTFMENKFSKSTLSDEEKSFIWQNYLNMTVDEMRLKLNKHHRTIYEFMGQNDIPTLIRLKSKKVKKGVVEGCFDESERDWLI